MSTLAAGGTPPRWARLGVLVEPALFLSIFVLFCISGGMLWLVGYNYDGLAGSALTKIHPFSYLICLTFAWSLIASGDPVGRLVHLFNRRPATWLMLGVSILVLVLTVLRDGPGLGGIVDTFISTCLLVLLLADADERLMERLESMLHIAMGVNAVMAIAELALQMRFFPYRFDGAVFATDTRSAALQGHPLANALVTACYLMALTSGRPVLSPAVRTLSIGLQSAALVAFGGRTALVLSIAFGGAYGIAAGFRALRRGRISLLAAAAGLMLLSLAPVAIGGLWAAGFFDDLIGRFVSDGGSANARKEMFELLGMFSLRDLIVGPDLQLVGTLRRVNGLEWGIENPFVHMTLYKGAFVTLIVTISFALLMVEISRGCRPGLWLPMVVWLVLLNGSESIAVKTTLPAKFVVLVFCLYRIRPSERPLRASPARAT